MDKTITERIVSLLAYCTFGIFSIIWIIFANLIKKRISPFLSFNLYQAIFISVVLAVISIIYDIAIKLLEMIPFLGKIAFRFDLFLNGTPLYFSYTLSGFIVSLFVLYLSIAVLMGKKPHIPYISDIIASNFGG